MRSLTLLLCLLATRAEAYPSTEDATPEGGSYDTSHDASPAPRSATPVTARRAAYEKSVAACKGAMEKVTLVQLKTTSRYVTDLSLPGGAARGREGVAAFAAQLLRNHAPTAGASTEKPTGGAEADELAVGAMLPGARAIGARIPAALLDRLLDDETLEPDIDNLEAACIVSLYGDETVIQPQTPSTPQGRRLGVQTGPPTVPWGLTRIDQPNGPGDNTYDWGASDGSGVKIYVLDTGVQISHSDFGGRALPGYSPGCRTAGARCNDYYYQGVINSAAGDSHGTHCSSTAAGTTYGVAKGAEIVTVQVLSNQGFGFTTDIIDGMNWVLDQVTDSSPPHRGVVSMSLGGTGSGYDTIVATLAAAGIPVVVAAGNTASANACTLAPAGAPQAITVGATDINDNEAYFSSFGECVDILAPGVNVEAAIISSSGGTEFYSGTSMATPHVAGAVALLLSKFPAKTAYEIEDDLKCVAQWNKITLRNGGSNSGTPNLFLHAGVAFDSLDSAPCVPAPAPPMLPPFPAPPTNPPGVVCGDRCVYAPDNDCDDGGFGAEFSECAEGYDCSDCGPRYGLCYDNFEDMPQGPSTCQFPEDGVCDDGGEGSQWSRCVYGHDCFDCGIRENPPAPIPETGISILDGSGPGGTANWEADVLFCLWPGDEGVKLASDVGADVGNLGDEIAAQCCEADGTCRRESDEGCIAGSAPPTPFTYGETVAECTRLGLVMCEQSCRGAGCQYNSHPVYTGLPCPP